LRIPKVVVEQYLTRKSGRSIQIEVPQRVERRRKSATWENRAILNLAKAALQNECQDRKAYRRIADRARLLTAHVPEDRWSEIVWFDDED
jgi:excinuclease UvrABC nuclease subunit